MTESNVLSLARREFKQGDLNSASKRLADFIHSKFRLEVEQVEIRNDGYSLNSVNGFVLLSDRGEITAPKRLFFKFHQEDGEGDTVQEYYRAHLLREHGFPVDMPLYASRDVGEQFLLYAERKCPRFADRCLEIEVLGSPPDQVIELDEAQRRLDDLVLDRYRATLHTAGRKELLQEPVLQLFFWRLVDHVDQEERGRGGEEGGLGGRWKKFFYGKDWAFPGVDMPIPYEDLARRIWVINGVQYQSSLKELFDGAYRVMDPRNVFSYPAVVAHGDAHNANVWLSPVAGQDRAELVLFDPAFAGSHIPALLAEIKPTFHNIFAHQQWLYQPRMADHWLEVRAAVGGDVIEVTHNWHLNALRARFLQSKAEHFWRPWLAHLKQVGLLPDNWREYLRSALFCCPTLVMNLRAGADSHTPKTSLLGLSIAVMTGSEPELGQADVVSEFLTSISP